MTQALREFFFFDQEALRELNMQDSQGKTQHETRFVAGAKYELRIFLLFANCFRLIIRVGKTCNTIYL